jgi:mRNA-degrading endonuclease toxin of MazEF toxin-antitoxin module
MSARRVQSVVPVGARFLWIRFDPADGDEIKKVQPAVVVSQNAIGRLRLKIVVPITEWNAKCFAASMVLGDFTRSTIREGRGSWIA